MTAYVIADIDIHDPEAYREYVALTPATLQPHGGRFVVRGGSCQVVEGDSPDYAAAKAIRQRASTGKLLLVEGAA
jgi:uncharacterized protein (DUF1330 family)